MAEADADIIIVGAGTAGLLLAEKLSRDPLLRVLVFEAGNDCTGHPDTQNVFTYFQNFGSERDWHFESIPQAGLKGRTATQNSGKLLGGSSAINGGYYVAPSRAGIDAWTKLGNSGWTYDTLRDACCHTIETHLPDSTVCQAMGIEPANSPESVGAGGPVHVTAELQEHPITKAYFRALKDLSYTPTSAIFNNHSAIAQSLYFTQDPISKQRSAADSAFGRVLEGRANVTVVTGAMVSKVILDGKPPHVRAKGVEVSRNGGVPSTVFALKEVVLSAGSLSTPKLLELSGVGQANLLQKHHIPIVIENAYVGERLRNHVMAAVHCELSQDVPPAAGMTGTAFMSSQHQPGLSDAIQAYQPQPGDDKVYDDTVRSIFTDTKEGSCYHFTGFMGAPNAVTFGVISTIPFSRGSVHISSSGTHDKPTVDPAFYTHPLDLEVMSRHLMTAATFPSQPALAPFFKMDGNGVPPAATVVADVNKAKEHLRETSLTTYHACGTASMRPKADGGVVDEQLKVYDTDNLRVVDASVIPLIPHGNPMATVYGVAHRAAEIIAKAVSSA